MVTRTSLVVSVLALILSGCNGSEGIRYETMNSEVRDRSSSISDRARQHYWLPLKIRVYLSNAEDGQALDPEQEKREAELALTQLSEFQKAYELSPFDLFSLDINVSTKGPREPKVEIDGDTLHMEIHLSSREPEVIQMDALLRAWAEKYDWKRDGRWHDGEKTNHLVNALQRDFGKLAKLEQELELECRKLELLAGWIRARAENHGREPRLSADETRYARSVQFHATFALHRVLNTFARWRLPANDENCSVRDEARVALTYARHIFAGHLGWLLETIVGGRSVTAVWTRDWWERNPIYEVLDKAAALVSLEGKEPGQIPAGSVQALLSLRLDVGLNAAFDDVDDKWPRWERNASAKSSSSPLEDELVKTLRRLPVTAERARVKGGSAFTAWKELWDARIKNTLDFPVYGAIVSLCLFFNAVGGSDPDDPPMSAETLEALEARLQPGDIMLVREESTMTSALLPGFWPHAVLYLGDANTWTKLKLRDGTPLSEDPIVKRKLPEFLEAQDDHPPRVIEAISVGVLFNTMEHAILKEHYVVVFRPKLPEHEIAAAIAQALSLHGRDYDFYFDFATDDKIVCTELIYQAYNGPLNFRVGIDAAKGSPAKEVPGVVSVAGRLTMPANELAKYVVYMTKNPTAKRTWGYPGQKLELVCLVHLDRGILTGAEALAELEASVEK